MNTYITKTHYNTQNDTIKLQILTESPIALYKDIAKIVQLLNKEGRKNERYYIIYAESKKEALNEAQSRL